MGSNRRKTDVDDSHGPWWDSHEPNRGQRCIDFVEKYCRNPKGYGFGEPMRLSSEQRDWFRRVLHPDTTAAVKSCMRGEGKSTEMAAMALWGGFDRNISGSPQIPIIATTLGQAKRSIYNPLLGMIDLEPEIQTRCLQYGSRGEEKVVIPSTAGEIFPMSNEINGLQGLDPLIAIMDEIGFQSIEAWDAVLLASGKRPDSLMIGCGTPGFNRNNALWLVRKAFKETGGNKGFQYLEIAAPEGCNYRDPEVWLACSPALRAGYKNVNALHTAVSIIPEAHFRIFYLGQWVEGADCWLGENGKRIWDANELRHDLSYEEPLWMGLDVGITSDTTALILLQPNGDSFHTVAFIWTPGKNGRVDVTDIQQQIRTLCAAYNVQSIGYDPRLFEIAGNQLLDEGYPMVKVPQSWEKLSPAYLELYRAILDGKITHEDDENYRTQIMNGVGRYNENGFIVSKTKSNGKIDCCVALCMAYMMFNNRIPPQPPMAIGSVFNDSRQRAQMRS